MVKSIQWLGIAILGLYFVSAPADGAAPFYEGKTIRLVVGTTPGGGFDAYSRAIGRHISKYIAGNPTIVVENMPGAGMLIATNYLYNQAKPDGLTIGNWIGTLVLGQVLGRKGTEFDARKFEYIGAPVKNHDLCLMTKASGITSVKKWMASKTPVKLGATPPGATPYDMGAIIKEALGLPTQLVSGYKGTADIRMAVDSGEVAGLCGLSYSSAKSTWRKQLESGAVTIVLQNTPKPHPDLPNIPLSIKLAKTDMGRRLIQTGIHDTSTITYLYSAPPGTPKERLQILRRAFMKTMEDPEFLAETKKANMDVDPVSGEELEKVVNGFFKLDPAIIGKLKEVLK